MDKEGGAKKRFKGSDKQRWCQEKEEDDEVAVTAAAGDDDDNDAKKRLKGSMKQCWCQKRWDIPPTSALGWRGGPVSDAAGAAADLDEDEDHDDDDDDDDPVAPCQQSSLTLLGNTCTIVRKLVRRPQLSFSTIYSTGLHFK